MIETDERLSPLVDIIKGKLTDIQKRNPRFSLRAFAARAALPHSTLSQVLNGKRPVNPSLIEKIGKGLNINDKEIEELQQYYYLEFSQYKDRDCRKKLSYEDAKYFTNWYVGALFELVQLSNFKSDTEWMAKMLNISTKEVEEAIEILLMLELIGVEGNHYYPKVNNYEFTIKPVKDNTTVKLTQLQRDLRNISLQSIDQVSVDERVHSSLILPFNSEDIYLVKKMMDRLRVKVNDFGDSMVKTKNQVYALTVSFFPVSNK